MAAHPKSDPMAVRRAGLSGRATHRPQSRSDRTVIDLVAIAKAKPGRS